MNILLISLISTLLFGIIDSLIFLFGEEYLQKKLNTIDFFDETMSEVLTGGISASIALFIASFIRVRLHQHYKILDHPLIDAIGIILGSLLVIIFYYLYKKIKKQ